MLTINGKNNSAICYTDSIDDESYRVLNEICNRPYSEGSSIRIMPDVHYDGHNSVVGFTMTMPDYIVMELIEGITLKQYMERRGRMDWREALHFITQIMRGLSHAHSRGIVHRDIKPHNIMILKNGSVKVADFGIACLSNTKNVI